MKTSNRSTHRAKLFVFVFALLTSAPAWAQVEFSMGLEAGINSSGLPFRHHETRTNGTSLKEKELPLVRAVGGVWGKVSTMKHFYASIGVQYTTIGSRYKEDGQGYDRINGVNFTLKTHEDFTFDKLSFPIILGYDFQIRKLPASFFVGYRAAILRSGSYHYIVSYADERGLRDHTHEKSIDPFDEVSLKISASKHPKQILVGAEVAVKSNFYISFFCAAGETISFVEKYPPGTDVLTSFVHGYDRWDLVLSLKYALLRFPKNERQ